MLSPAAVFPVTPGKKCFHPAMRHGDVERESQGRSATKPETLR